VAPSLLAAEVLLERPVTPNWADPDRRVVCVARSRTGCSASPSASSSAKLVQSCGQERVPERRLRTSSSLATEHRMRFSAEACGLRLEALNSSARRAGHFQTAAERGASRDVSDQRCRKCKRSRLRRCSSERSRPPSQPTSPPRRLTCSSYPADRRRGGPLRNGAATASTTQPRGRHPVARPRVGPWRPFLLLWAIVSHARLTTRLAGVLTRTAAATRPSVRSYSSWRFGPLGPEDTGR
jgi:hypothetical protein